MKKFLNNPVKAEKMIQRIYSKALFLKENESPSIAAKILKIMNIMREGEEFYIEESSGVLAALPRIRMERHRSPTFHLEPIRLLKRQHQRALC